MTCRHGPNDPSCSSHKDHERLYGSSSYTAPTTPDKYKYEIEEVERVGNHLVIKALYPNCKSCAYEGRKVMVFLNVTEGEALRWREIDPHFRSPQQLRAKTEAPPPAARFPASPEGWADALTYARSKAQQR